MAHQKLCLESLFHYVVRRKELSLNEICCYFNTTIGDVKHIIKKLHTMGLPLTIDSNSIKLIKNITPLDVNFIQSHYKNSIFYCFSTDSTNTLAKTSSQDAVFLTEQQMQGRGQHGKSWLTPLGQSIALSLSHSFDFPLHSLSGLNIAVGVAVIQVIKQFSNQLVSLKWPNDIIGESGKIAGILIEAQGSKRHCKACIGIGINWDIAQGLLDTINQPCMNVQISTLNRSQFIVYLINHIEKVIEEFKLNKLNNLMVQWNNLDLHANKTIYVTEPTRSYQATYMNIDCKGMLRVRLGQEIRLISSASIKIK